MRMAEINSKGIPIVDGWGWADIPQELMSK